MNLGLNDKVAVVLASSKGLGKACAMELYREGAHVMLVARNEIDLVSAKNELEHLGLGKVSYCTCDITNYEDIRKLVRQTHDQLGKVDILINNSGGPKAGTFENFNDQDWQNGYELTLLSYIRMIREFLPDLKATKGRIINLSSSSIKQPITGLLLSNVFRMGVQGLSKSLAEELAPFGIYVHTIAPGRIATERAAMIDQAKALKQGVAVEDVMKQSTDRILMGRYGLPEEFGKVVAFFASGVCSYMTGSSIMVDGGMVRAY